MSSNRDRERWEVSGPHFPGRSIYALAYDGRVGRQRLWAGSSHLFGTLLHSSDDFGRTWTNPESSPVKFPEDTGQSLKQIWQIALGCEQEPDKMYCGVEPGRCSSRVTQGKAGRSYVCERHGVWTLVAEPQISGRGAIFVHHEKRVGSGAERAIRRTGFGSQRDCRTHAFLVLCFWGFSRRSFLATRTNEP